MRNRLASQINRRFFAEPLESRTLLNAADLDTTFGSAGIATTQFSGYGSSSVQAVALQSDGKLIAVGRSVASVGVIRVAIARYNTDGSLDTTFGTGGTEQLAIGSIAEADAVAIQSDGKIVIAGDAYPTNSSTQLFMVARLNTNGALDTTFNTTGINTFTISGGQDFGYAVAIQSDGKIVVGGQEIGSNTQMAVVRLNTNGALDSTFGTGGKVTARIDNNTTTCRALAIDSSGDILAAGKIGTSTSGDTAMGYVRFDTRGFQVGAAERTINSNAVEGAASIAILNNGDAIVAGTTNATFAAIAFNSSDTLDTSFASSGVFNDTTTGGSCASVKVLSSGAILLAGATNTSNDQAMAIRLTSSGAFDDTFGTSGVALFGPPHEMINAAAVRSSGALVVAGTPLTQTNMLLAQATASGAVDTTFGAGGSVNTEFVDPATTTGRSAILQSDGELVVGSVYQHSQTSSHGQQSALTRYAVAGAVDTTFGTNGSALIVAGDSSNLVAMVSQSNGDIVIEATVQHSSPSSSSVLIERFLPNGTLDSSFGVAGQRILDSTAGFGPFNTAAALIVQPDDSLLVVTFSNPSGYITKLTANGQIDTTYGTAGTGMVTSSNLWVSGTLDPSGRLVVAANGTLVRYLANGTVDSSFSPPPYINAPYGTGNFTMTSQPDGKIILASQGSMIERYLPTGALDNTFGSSGVATSTGGYNGAVLVLGGGDIIAAGITIIMSSIGSVTAFDPGGHQLGTFGSNGTTTIPGTTAANAILMRPNGKLIFIGQTSGGAESVTQLVGDLPTSIQGTAANDAITLSQSADGQYINWTEGTSAGKVGIVDPAGLTINGNGGADTITLVGSNALPNTLHLNGTFTINGLTGSNPLANTNLEIGTSTVYITYANAATDPLATIRGYLKNGYNAGLWTGAPTSTTGVITSTAAAANANKNTAIGYADSAEGLVSLPANTIELKYTLYGDTGLTGSVGFTDFMRMTQHFTQSGQTWGRGDFNYDGSVNSADFNLLQPNYGQALPAPAQTPVVSVLPTPARPARTPMAPPPPLIVYPMPSVLDQLAVAVDPLPSATSSPVQPANKHARHRGRKIRI